jgi:hypothetical protein
VRLRRPRLLDRSADRARIALGGLPSETLVAALVADGLAVRELVVERRTLEDVFVGLTGGETA